MSERSDLRPELDTAMRDRLRAEARAVPTSRLGRLWRTGRSAAGLATAALGGRMRSHDDGLSGADLEAVARLVERLGELKGVAMKAGQILGYIDVTLPAELRTLLSVLQTSAPASPWPTVEATVRAAFGNRADALLAGLEPAPIAVASIGQVHRGVLTDGTAVAVKVRHPGIEDALRADFATAGVGAAFARLMPGGASVRGFLDEARTAMLEECDLALEATRQDRFHDLFAGHPVLTIPATVPAWCAPAVLTTRWAPGRSLDQLLASAPPAAVRDRLGVALFELYVGTLYRHGLFHADPHPGNYGFTPDGRVVVYDFGCVRQFEPDVVEALTRLLRAVRDDHLDAMLEAIAALGATPPVDGAGRTHLRTLLRGFFAPLLIAGPHPIHPGDALDGGQAFRDKRALMALRLPGSLLFLLRLRFGLYAVLARLGAVADWAALEEAWATGSPVREPLVP